MSLRERRSLSFPLVLGLLIVILLDYSVWAQDPPVSNTILQEKAANNLLKRAREYYDQGAFSKAAQELISVTDYYPEFSKIDEVFLKLGDVLVQMELYDAADKIYKHLVRLDPNSPTVPIALYGLARINYLQGKFQRTLDFVKFLNDNYGKTEVDDGMAYYAGLCQMGLQDYDGAIASFDQIPRESEFRGYGLYSRAISHFKKKMLITLLPT